MPQRFQSSSRLSVVLLLLITFFLLGLPASGQEGLKEKEQVDITGRFKAVGKYVPTKAEYVADVEITKQGDVYRVLWKSGPRAWDGVGLLDDNKLVVATYDQEGKNLAVISYKIMPGDNGLKLVGRWSYKGDKVLSTETLERVK